MVEPSHNTVSSPRAVEQARTPATAQPAKPGHGAAFQALLEKLDREAIGLQRQSQSIESAADLGPAVERARGSLQQAFDLRDQLIEAWRANRQSAQK